MIFQKKIIIGSIMSFIATAIGIIAVFFPDLLNMQKEKIEKMQTDIITNEQLISLDDFLLKRIKDGKIFELDILISEELKRKYINEGSYFIPTRSMTTEELDSDNFDVYSIMESVEIDESILYIHHGDLIDEYTGKEWHDDLRIQEDAIFYSREMGHGNVYHFPKKLVASPDGFPREPLSNKIETGCCFGIKGIFYYSEEDSNENFNTYIFKQVPESQLKLKNY